MDSSALDISCMDAEPKRGIELELEYKLLITDMDGTLLDSRQEVPGENRSAIQRLIAAGGLYTFATGRNEEAAMPYAKDLAINAPAILYNGARVVDLERSEALLERHLPLEEAVSVLTLATTFDVRVNLYMGGKIYVERIDPVIREYMAKDRVTCVEIGNLTAFLKRGRANPMPTKFLAIGDGATLESLREVVHTTFPALSLVRSEPTYLEVLPPGVCKGAALHSLCEHLGIERRQVVAMGDGPNDIELIEAAGLGIAVENAHPSLKERAGFISPSNEACGVAEVVRRFFKV